jgi:hypothetical protein
MKYKLADGSIYEGPVCKMPDGRFKTGETLTGDSVRAWPIEDHQVERARNESGAFVADDPSTPEVNEAYRAKRKPRGKVKSK